jgi:hypothetical protein
MKLVQLISDVADILVAIDSSGVPFKSFREGVGPYGEPQLVRLIKDRLNGLDAYHGGVITKRAPDLLLKGEWALEFKIARPYGDNGKPAENWSVNLLHPYEGNISAIGDCLKLLGLGGPERKAVVVIGYEHTPPQLSIDPLLAAFEVVARDVAKIILGPRLQITRRGLVHPVHQQLTVTAWEVLGRSADGANHTASRILASE